MKHWLLLLVLFGAGVARAHENLPAYLELREQKPAIYRVLWKTPAIEGAPAAIAFTTPVGCRALAEETAPPTPGSIARVWTMECSGGLAGKRIEVLGLPLTLLDVLVRVRLLDGSSTSHILRPSEPAFVVASARGSHADMWSHLRLGVEHILYGVDHLFFVLGLLLIVRGASLLFKTISAFTIAHTLTLALATFGIVRIPVAPTEAVIALSIVFLGSELALYRRGQVGLTYRSPWVVAFAFGLLHGFGFAGTLSRIGIPSAEIPAALLLFNCGVELGQLAFVIAFLTLVQSLRQLELRWPSWMEEAVPYAFGGTAALWFIQRCAALI